MTLRKLYIAIITALTLPTLQGCFTGVESTPRITYSDVKKEHIEPTDEQKYMQHIKVQPLAQWVPGKQFYVTDPKIALILTSESPIDTLSLVGTTLWYSGIRPLEAFTGETLAVIDLVTPQGQTLSYRTQIPYSKVTERDNTDIPFAVDLDLVQAVKEEINGKRFYITNPLWYDQMGQQAVNGLRHVEVTVDDVQPGNAVFPIRVVFTPTGKTERYSVFMSAGKGNGTTRNFDSLFAFENPRKQYPHITDEMWQLITHSRVKAGMTRDECRLALGAPKTISQRPTTAGMVELWQYPDGIYLLFEDGLLSSNKR